MFKDLSKNISYFASIVFCFLAFGAMAQEDTIRLVNPSFEGIPHGGSVGVPTAEGWYDCGRINFPSESPPDLHPNKVKPLFDVTKPAQHGDTYLGMVVRDNDTWESVSQRLSAPMIAGKCYSFSLYLARSADYKSAVGMRDSNAPTDRDPNRLVNHNTPASLRIWGGNGYCDKSQLLASTSEIPHERWIEYQYKFEPNGRVTYVTLEVFYKIPTPFPYNGNLLIDNLSDIALTPCIEEAPEIAFTKPKKNGEQTTKKLYTFNAKIKNVRDKNGLTVIFNNNLVEEYYFDTRKGDIAVPAQRLRKGKNTLKIKAQNGQGQAVTQRTVELVEENEAVVAVQDPVPAKTKTEPALAPSSTLLKRSELERGKTIRIDKLYFPADSSTIKRESYGALDEVYDFLNQNPDVIVEIGGHTNSVPPPDYCFKLSSARAKAVAVFLAQKGISTERLKYKGYGKTKPIASNKTREGRIKNQRVEIKILGFDG